MQKLSSCKNPSWSDEIYQYHGFSSTRRGGGSPRHMAIWHPLFEGLHSLHHYIISTVDSGVHSSPTLHPPWYELGPVSCGPRWSQRLSYAGDDNHILGLNNQRNKLIMASWNVLCEFVLVNIVCMELATKHFVLSQKTSYSLSYNCIKTSHVSLQAC